MANITVSTSRTIASAEANLGNGQNFTIINGAVLTIDQSPTKLIGQTKINDGVMLFDGANAVNPIIYCGEDLEEINVNGVGKLETTQEVWEYNQRELTSAVQAGLDENALHAALDTYPNKDVYKAGNVVVDLSVVTDGISALDSKIDAVPTRVWGYVI